MQLSLEKLENPETQSAEVCRSVASGRRDPFQGRVHRAWTEEAGQRSELFQGTDALGREREPPASDARITHYHFRFIISE